MRYTIVRLSNEVSGSSTSFYVVVDTSISEAIARANTLANAQAIRDLLNAAV